MASAAERRLYWSMVASVVGLDVVTKLVAEALLLRGTGHSVLGEWLQLRLVYNPGAAFGLHLGPYSRWIFFTIAVVAVVVLYRMSRASAPGDFFRQVALGLVSGGALGNLLDRIRSSQGVADFIDIGVGSVRWPTFNVADIAVSCGAVALALSLWREDARRAAAEEAGRARPATPPAPIT